MRTDAAGPAGGQAGTHHAAVAHEDFQSMCPYFLIFEDRKTLN
jgi:hypothetical protein